MSSDLKSVGPSLIPPTLPQIRAFFEVFNAMCKHLRWIVGNIGTFERVFAQCDASTSVGSTDCTMVSVVIRANL